MKKEKHLTEEFLTLNEVIANIQILWSDMTDDDKEECIQSFFGLRNKHEMLRFIEKYTPVKH